MYNAGRPAILRRITVIKEHAEHIEKKTGDDENVERVAVIYIMSVSGNKDILRIRDDDGNGQHRKYKFQPPASPIAIERVKEMIEIHAI